MRVHCAAIKKKNIVAECSHNSYTQPYVYICGNNNRDSSRALSSGHASPNSLIALTLIFIYIPYTVYKVKAYISIRYTLLHSFAAVPSVGDDPF
jgi:hypothetical protein